MHSLPIPLSLFATLPRTRTTAARKRVRVMPQRCACCFPGLADPGAGPGTGLGKGMGTGTGMGTDPDMGPRGGCVERQERLVGAM